MGERELSRRRMERDLGGLAGRRQTTDGWREGKAGSDAATAGHVP